MLTTPNSGISTNPNQCHSYRDRAAANAARVHRESSHITCTRTSHRRESRIGAPQPVWNERNARADYIQQERTNVAAQETAQEAATPAHLRRLHAAPAKAQGRLFKVAVTTTRRSTSASARTSTPSPAPRQTWAVNRRPNSSKEEPIVPPTSTSRTHG